MNTILVPIDFSPASKNAFYYALEIANLFHSKIILFHIYNITITDPYIPNAMQASILEEQQETIKKYFDILESEIPQHISNHIEVDKQISLGVASDEILEYCKKFSPSLIVMGMKVNGDLTRAIMGSTSTNVLQKTEHPLLIVPEMAHYEGIKNIAYATNFEADDLKTIERLIEFAFLYDAVIHCVHIEKEGDRKVEDIEAKTQQLKAHFQDDIILNQIDFTTLNKLDIIDGLCEYAETHKIDMIAILTHHKGFWGRLFTQSIAKKMAFHTHTPLLIFHT